MGKKEKAAKQAAFAMQKELDSEMTEEERAAKEKSGMGLFGGLNKGEDQLFGAAAPAPCGRRRAWLTCSGRRIAHAFCQSCAG